MDEDVKQLVKSWRVPAASGELDRRMLSAFRRRIPWWRRRWTIRIDIPMPALAAAVIVALLLGTLLVRARFSQSTEAGGWHPVAEPTLKVIRNEAPQ